MAIIRDGFGIGSLSEISDEESIRVSIDLVAVARKNVRFIRNVAENDWLHHTPTIVEAIRRSKFTLLVSLRVICSYGLYGIRDKIDAASSQV